MTRVERVEAGIRQVSSEELARFVSGLRSLTTNRGTVNLSPMSEVKNFDDLAANALRDHQAGRSTKLDN